MTSTQSGVVYRTRTVLISLVQQITRSLCFARRNLFVFKVLSSSLLCRRFLNVIDIQTVRHFIIFTLIKRPYRIRKKSWQFNLDEPVGGKKWYFPKHFDDPIHILPKIPWSITETKYFRSLKQYYAVRIMRSIYPQSRRIDQIWRRLTLTRN